tara:strand:- start:915 stop:1319 length:405 start_codon:yes stop_codon:yes gene_type:complete
MKRLVSKTGTYTKEGQEKGEYTKIGVLLEGEGGEYMILDPTVNLAGVLLKQNALAAAQGKQQRDSVMVSVFTEDGQGQQAQQPQQAPQHNQGYQQPNAPQQAPQQPQGGYQQANQQPAQQPAAGFDNFDDDIPF